MPAEPRFVRIRDRQYKLCMVAGDVFDGCVYHQEPNGRANSVWAMLLVGDQLPAYEFRDMKHGFG